MENWMVAVGAIIALVIVIVGLPALVGQPIELPTPLPESPTVEPTQSFEPTGIPEGTVASPSAPISRPIATEVPSRKVSIQEAQQQGYSYCGDGVCDASESCGSCQQDCGCSTQEFCATSGVCQEKEVVGDGICTLKEKSIGSCTDCGCTGNALCNQYTDKCTAPVDLSPSLTKSIIDKYTQENPSDTLASISDSYLGENAVKAFSFDCSKQYFCRVELLVNSTGNIVETLQTT